jgi:glycosyltransferase involved in cell wall biosynthesis
MKGFSIVIPTFERPESICKCINSIRVFYPDIEVVVVNNGHYYSQILTETKRLKIHLAELPFDSGVSMSRNAGIDILSTKYVVVCDDDFEFTERTKLETFHRILELDDCLGLIAGDVFGPESTGPRTSRLEVNEKDKYFCLVPISRPKWIHAGSAVKYHYADHVPQFFMMRNKPELRWDPDLKCQYEHIEYSLRQKRLGKWKFGFTPDVSVFHNRVRPSSVYQMYRTRQDDWERFYRKTGFTDNISGVEKPEFDANGKRVLPFPEYVFKLMREYQKSHGLKPDGLIQAPKAKDMEAQSE